MYSDTKRNCLDIFPMRSFSSLQDEQYLMDIFFTAWRYMTTLGNFLPCSCHAHDILRGILDDLFSYINYYFLLGASSQWVETRLFPK